MILFAGEHGIFLKVGFDQGIYSGGFMGNAFNQKLGAFTFEDGNFKYDRLIDTKFVNERGFDMSKELGRLGHIAFWDSEWDSLIIFGGEKISG